jgi:hypothetical protein
MTLQKRKSSQLHYKALSLYCPKNNVLYSTMISLLLIVLGASTVKTCVPACWIMAIGRAPSFTNSKHHKFRNAHSASFPMFKKVILGQNKHFKPSVSAHNILQRWASRSFSREERASLVHIGLFITFLSLYQCFLRFFFLVV